MKLFARLFRPCAHLIAATLTVFSASSSYAFFLPPPMAVFEFVNDITKRRLLLREGAEMNAVESGQAGLGWRRSGMSFGAPWQSGTPNLASVFRFYAPSVNSHFYTMNLAEVEALKNPSSGWIYEGPVFSGVAPVGGACSITSPVPIHRLYNNRAQFGDTTHRYTPDEVVRNELVKQGWIDEGAAMCATFRLLSSVASYEMTAKKVVPSAECEDESRELGPCVALNQTPLLPFLVRSDDQLPKFFGFVPENLPPLGHLPRFWGLWKGDIYSLVNSPQLSDITAHSFVQLEASGSSKIGVYVNSKDRTTSPAFPYMSINPIYQFFTSPPTPNEADRRVMPWRGNFARILELSFDLDVSHIRRADEASHAISHITLELIDTRSRKNLYITVVGAQTVPLPKSAADDYFAADISTGRVIVSTSFRDNPSFGERVTGTSIFCTATTTSHECDQARGGRFVFRLRPTDIAYVIAKARTLDPLLSPNIADYAIDNFSFNNELYGNAELAVGLGYYQLKIFEQQY